jgi:hypothetical protein
MHITRGLEANLAYKLKLYVITAFRKRLIPEYSAPGAKGNTPQVLPKVAVDMQRSGIVTFMAR